jgi:alkylhydroperoxidase family enzyme
LGRFAYRGVRRHRARNCGDDSRENCCPIRRDFRLRASLIQLFDALEDQDGTDASQAASGADLWPALDRFLTHVAALDQLDPVTTELVRLRGARAHNCRICQSRREVHAVTSGASESTFDQIDFYETSDLDERSKVALRLTDALIWQPAAYPAGLVDEVRSTFSPAEALEIVLDVVRNAANKVAVALQADQAVVASGVEFFALESDGSLRYGLTAPANVGAAAG